MYGYIQIAQRVPKKFEPLDYGRWRGHSRVAALDQSALCPLLRWTAVVVVDAVVVVSAMVPGTGTMMLPAEKFEKNN
jgi:hypothetical protein